VTWSGQHLLDIDQLEAGSIEKILAFAEGVRDVTSGATYTGLRGHKVALLFDEPSTRTRLSFEVAARDLAAQTYLLEPQSSSMVKGETLVDTVRNLDAIGFTYMVVRHHRAGAAAVAARYFGGSVVNAGDGWHAHPTQALLDLFTLMRALGLRPGRGPIEGALRGRKVAIVGDVLHSRVARSNVGTLTRTGAEVVLCGPSAWVRGLESLPAHVTTDLDVALRDADAVMGLRVQKERMAAGVSLGEYVERYQITERRLARAAPGARYLHPGPINEGIEVTREVARGPRSLVLEQARNGVAVRMGVLSTMESLRAERELATLPHDDYVGTRF
jgi:aspartate carbamoyltransferase catalytic subunit